MAAEVVFLCIKPQDFHEVAGVLNRSINKDSLVISIMAGITIQTISDRLQISNVVRAMPNAPSFYGKGMTVFCSTNGLMTQKKDAAEMLLAVTGKICEVEDEKLLNAVTAISGSGPAYFFYLAEKMISEAMQMGIEKQMAETLVKQTISGASVMLNESGKSCSELIRTVASKGGTTEAALDVFKNKGLPEIISEGLQNAAIRAAELSQ